MYLTEILSPSSIYLPCLLAPLGCIRPSKSSSLMASMLWVEQSGFNPLSGSFCRVLGQNSLLSQKTFSHLSHGNRDKFWGLESLARRGIYHLFIEIL